MSEKTIKLILPEYLFQEFAEFLSQNNRYEDILLTPEVSSPGNPGKNKGYKTESLRLRISKLLKQLGISPKLKGYSYIRAALEIILDDSQAILAITKKIYPAIASMYNTSPSNVERAIRHAIISLWETDSRIYYNKITQHCSDSRPTNGQFLAQLAEFLTLDPNAPAATQSLSDQFSAV